MWRPSGWPLLVLALLALSLAGWWLLRPAGEVVCVLQPEGVELWRSAVAHTAQMDPWTRRDQAARDETFTTWFFRTPEGQARTLVRWSAQHWSVVQRRGRGPEEDEPAVQHLETLEPASRIRCHWRRVRFTPNDGEPHHAPH